MVCVCTVTTIHHKRNDGTNLAYCRRLRWLRQIFRLDCRLHEQLPQGQRVLWFSAFLVRVEISDLRWIKTTALLGVKYKVYDFCLLLTITRRRWWWRTPSKIWLFYLISVTFLFTRPLRSQRCNSSSAKELQRRWHCNLPPIKDENGQR